MPIIAALMLCIDPTEFRAVEPKKREEIRQLIAPLRDAAQPFAFSHPGCWDRLKLVLAARTAHFQCIGESFEADVSSRWVQSYRAEQGDASNPIIPIDRDKAIQTSIALAKHYTAWKDRAVSGENSWSNGLTLRLVRAWRRIPVAERREQFVFKFSNRTGLLESVTFPSRFPMFRLRTPVRSALRIRPLDSAVRTAIEFLRKRDIHHAFAVEDAQLQFRRLSEPDFLYVGMKAMPPDIRSVIAKGWKSAELIPVYAIQLEDKNPFSSHRILFRILLAPDTLEVVQASFFNPAWYGG